MAVGCSPSTSLRGELTIRLGLMYSRIFGPMSALLRAVRMAIESMVHDQPGLNTKDWLIAESGDVPIDNISQPSIVPKKSYAIISLKAIQV